MELKGGTLYYSLIVIILASSTIGMILIASFYMNKDLLKTMKDNQLDRNVSSAINLFLTGEVNCLFNDSIYIDLYNDGIDNVTIKKKQWGNYQIIDAKARWLNRFCSKTALVGNDMRYQESIALFIADAGRTISLSGNTLLEGICYLPGKTARPESIEGQPYTQKEIVYGEIKKSPNLLPEINSALFDFARKYIDYNQFEDSIIYLSKIGNEKFTNSFNNKTLFLYNDNLDIISNNTFVGNIIIWSIMPVTVDNSAVLKDVILLAPKITIRSGFKGSLQAYALQTITIESGCKLEYPSQLNVIQGDNFSYDPTDTLMISIGKQSLIEGGCIISTKGLMSFMKIEKDTKIIGQVYCPEVLEFYGEVIGSVFCKTFYLTFKTSKYYNHLLNVKIDYTNLSKNFSGIDLLNESSNKEVIKWLD